MRSRRFKGVITVFLILVVCALGIWLYTLHLEPRLSGSLRISGVQSKTEVHFDEYGVPHIYANNAMDAYRALGYVHAQDRLFQMELMRRAGRGELSAVLGKKMLDADMLFRTLGITQKANKEAALMRKREGDEKYVHIIEAYLAGINSFIKHGPTPIEFTLAGIPAKPFTLEDVHAIAGYMTFSFAFALRADPIIEYMYRKLSAQHLADISMGRLPGTKMIPACNSSDADSFAANLPGYFDNSVVDDLPVPVLQGSNSWAIAPRRSTSGQVLLGNDTHIKFQQPPVWYEAHLEYPGFSFYGNFLGGIPFGLIGHSRHHAWGITMFENDDMDFYKERYTHDGKAFVYRDSLAKKVEKRTETIKIKDQVDTVITVEEGPHGPIVNRLLNDNFDAPIAANWTYTSLESHLFSAFYEMNYARNMQEFKAAVSKIHAPGLNITYGDSTGHIALWAAARLAKRQPNSQGKLFMEGWSGHDDKLGYYPFSANPQYTDPPCGYLFSANNAHDSTAAGAYPGYYAPDNRARRITNVLESKEKWSLNGLKQLSVDISSPAEAVVCHTIAQVLDTRKAQLSQPAKRALPLLFNWQGKHGVNQAAPVIYYATLVRLLRLAMADELGQKRYASWATTHLFKQTYPKLIKNKQAVWWNDVNTPDVHERRADLMQKAFEDAVNTLRKKWGPNATGYRWGDIHTLTFAHALGSVDALAPFFNVGPFEAPGGNETVNNGAFNLGKNEPFRVEYGPQMRILLDFADVENSVSVLPTGQSGNPFSPHYKDQAKMFVHGKFRKQMMNETQIRSNTEAKLVIKSR